MYEWFFFCRLETIIWNALFVLFFKLYVKGEIPIFFSSNCFKLYCHAYLISLLEINPVEVVKNLSQDLNKQTNIYGVKLISSHIQDKIAATILWLTDYSGTKLTDYHGWLFIRAELLQPLANSTSLCWRIIHDYHFALSG